MRSIWNGQIVDDTKEFYYDNFQEAKELIIENDPDETKEEKIEHKKAYIFSINDIMEYYDKDFYKSEIDFIKEHFNKKEFFETIKAVDKTIGKYNAYKESNLRYEMIYNESFIECPQVHRKPNSYRIFKEFIKSQHDHSSGTYMIYYAIKHKLTLEEFEKYIDEQLLKMKKSIWSGYTKFEVAIPYYALKDIVSISDEDFKAVKHVPYTVKIDNTRGKGVYESYYHMPRTYDESKAYYSYTLCKDYYILNKDWSIKPSYLVKQAKSVNHTDLFFERLKIKSEHEDYLRRNKSKCMYFSIRKNSTKGSVWDKMNPNEIYIYFGSSIQGGLEEYEQHCKRIKEMCILFYHLLKMLDEVEIDETCREQYCLPIQYDGYIYAVFTDYNGKSLSFVPECMDNNDYITQVNRMYTQFVKNKKVPISWF